MFKADNNKFDENGNSKIDEIFESLSKYQKLKNNKSEVLTCTNIHIMENLYSYFLVLKKPWINEDKCLLKLWSSGILI